MPGVEHMISKSVLLAIVLAPLLGAILAGLFGRRIGRVGAHTATIAGVAASFGLSAYVLWQLVGQGAPPFNENVYTWFQVGPLQAHVGDVAHPRSLPCASTSIEPVLRKRSTRIASPIADSAAATVRMKNTKTCPAMSPR